MFWRTQSTSRLTFEADRFNRSRTSPESKCRQFLLPLPAISKERLQQVRAAPGQHSAANLDAVIRILMVQHLHYRVYRASFGIFRAIHQPPDAGMNHSSGAHGARFNCNKEVTIPQTVVRESGAGLAQRRYFGVCSGIELANVAIPSPANNPAGMDHDGSYWHFTALQRPLRTAQRLFHPQFVGW
jgi:hypothetical protein